MKKFTALLLALICLFTLAASAASAEGASWQEKKLKGTEGKLRTMSDEDGRIMAYFGPGKTYPDAGSYLPRKAMKVTVYFREGDFCYADLTYQTAGRRCVYFRAADVPGLDLKKTVLKAHPAHMTAMAIPFQGPGTEYEAVTQSKESPYASWSFEELASAFGGSYEIMAAVADRKYSVYLEKGTALEVFFETDGWVFAEFTCSVGKIRAWVPAENVEAD